MKHGRQGWKVNLFGKIARGETLTLAGIEGLGECTSLPNTLRL